MEQVFLGGGIGVAMVYFVIRLVDRYMSDREKSFNQRQEQAQKSMDAQNERVAKTFDRLAATQQQISETTLKLTQYASTGLENLRQTVTTTSQEIVRQGDENTVRVIDEIHAVPGKVHELASADIERVIAAVHDAKASILRDVLERMDALEKKAVASLVAPKELN